MSVAPSGIASAPYRGATPTATLHATVMPQRAAPELEPADAQPQASAQREGEPSPVDVKTEERAGSPGGVDLPIPNKWYTATEVDVRAEPLGEVRLEYPQELEGTGIPGRVRIALYIDERGIVSRLEVTEAEPSRLFDKAAIAAWRDVKFSPAKKDGVAVKSQKLLELDFRP